MNKFVANKQCANSGHFKKCVFQHRDSFGTEKLKKSQLVRYLIRHYAKYF